MSGVAGEINNYNFKTGRRDRIEIELQCTIGATGVVNAPLVGSDDPAMNIVRGGSAGLYNVTFPPGADLRGTFDVTLISPAGTVKGWYGVSFAPNSGTLSFQTINASGTATDPASADQIAVTITLSRLKDL